MFTKFAFFDLNEKYFRTKRNDARNNAITQSYSRRVVGGKYYSIKL